MRRSCLRTQWITIAPAEHRLAGQTTTLVSTNIEWVSLDLDWSVPHLMRRKHLAEGTEQEPVPRAEPATPTART